MRVHAIKAGAGEKHIPNIIKYAALFCLTALVLSLIPLLLLAPYAAPVLDDFIYGTPIHFTLEAGKGFPSVLSAVWENIVYTYMDWQGTFSSVILFSLEPGAFSESAYGLTAWVYIAAIIASVFLALGTVRGLGLWPRLFIGGVVSFLAVQYLPSTAQWIYWWNGASHYLAFWTLSVLAVFWQTRLSRRDGTGKSFYCSLVFGCILSFLVGGGNYCTALVFPLVSACLAAYAFWAKRPKPVLSGNILMLLMAVIGLAVSILAPGNAVRQAAFEKLSPISAVVLSFKQAGTDLFSMLDLKLLGAVMLCIPVFLYASKDSVYSFRLPLLILAGSFCAYAALYTPPLYAMGGTEPLEMRIQNLMYIAALFLIFGNAFYLSGWLSRRIGLFEKKHILPILAAILALGGVIFAASVLTQYRDSNAYRAYADLRSPLPETYSQDRAERRRIFADKSIQPPRFQPLSDPPQSFYQARMVTWCSDLLLDGVPVDMDLYHGRGGEVTYVGLDYALDFFGVPGKLGLTDFSRSFHVRGTDYVSLRELCDLLDIGITYISEIDTVMLETKGS